MAKKWRRGNMGSKSLVFNQDPSITPRFVVTTRPRFSSLLEVNGEAKPLHTYNKIEKKTPMAWNPGLSSLLEVNGEAKPLYTYNKIEKKTPMAWSPRLSSLLEVKGTIEHANILL
jgi:hypothetical protein